MPAEARTRTRRSGLAPLCAKSWALLCLALGCLNPSPDDQPSNKTSQGVPVSPPADSAAEPGATGGDFLDQDDQSPPATGEPQGSTTTSGRADAGVPQPDAGPDADTAVQ
jgi:hypothetical protein